MTTKTLLKAKAIYKAGGVERVGVRIYRVKSTSGEEYGVVLAERGQRRGSSSSSGISGCLRAHGQQCQSR